MARNPTAARQTVGAAVELPPQQSAPPATRRGPSGWTVLILLLLLALVVFLVFPLQAVSVQPWLPALQTQWRTGFAQAGPYAVVALLGALVGLAEVSATFPGYPREALRTRWARFLILVNAAAAGLAFWIARAYAPAANLVLTVIGVGVGFQALIRTRFVIAKQIGGAGESDVSLNLGWLYDQFQNLCKTQIDLELMQGRQTAVSGLLQRFPNLAELNDIAAYTIVARATLTPEQEKARLDELNKLFKEAPANMARASMALMVLENGGQAYVDLLLGQPPAGAPQPAAPENIAATVSRLLQRYPTLQELYNFAAYALQTRAKLTPEQQQARMEELQRLLDPKAPADVVRASLGLFVVETAGQEYVDFVLSQGEAGAPGAVTPESVVRRLVEKYSPTDLVALAGRLTASPEVLDWVKRAAGPAPGASEASQKAAIAHFLVQRLGVEAVLKGMEG